MPRGEDQTGKKAADLFWSAAPVEQMTLDRSAGSLLGILGALRNCNKIFSHFWCDGVEQGIRFVQLLANAAGFRHPVGPVIRSNSTRSGKPCLVAAFHVQSPSLDDTTGIALRSVISEGLYRLLRTVQPATFDTFSDRFSIDGVRPEMPACCSAIAGAVFAATQSGTGERNFCIRADHETPHHNSGLVGCSAGPAGVEFLSADRLLPGVHIADPGDDLAQVQDGKIGQNALAGACFFSGYYSNPFATDAAFHNGWFVTGESGAVMDDESFVTDRLKNVISVNSRRFYAHDVEECISRVDEAKPGRVAASAIYNEATRNEEVSVIAKTIWELDHYPDASRILKRTVGWILDVTAVEP